MSVVKAACPEGDKAGYCMRRQSSATSMTAAAPSPRRFAFAPRDGCCRGTRQIRDNF